LKHLKTLIKITLSIGIFIGILYLLDTLYAFGLKQNRNLKAAYIQTNKKDADILFHGPCEPLWMLDPAQIDPLTKKTSYNLSLSHSDFADNYLHLYLYLQHNKAPEYMFLYVTPESLDKKFNTFNTYRFAGYMNDSMVAAVVKENDRSYYNWSKIPFMRFAYYNSRITFQVLQGYKHYFSGRAEAFYPNGFEPPAKIVWDNHLEDMQQQYPQGYRFVIDSLRVKYLEKTIELAKANNIKVLLYESPVLTESLKSTVNREEMLQEIQHIAKKEGVVYQQFDHLPLSASRNYFISSLNLNTEGLRIFNDTLAAYIKRLP
jgi:hypothetical protein